MKTAVDHVRNARLYTDAQTVYIGRPGRGEPGPFGNPIIIGRRCRICGATHLTRALTLPCFEAWARARMDLEPEYREAVQGLRGKVLLCFCAPGPCHGEVLARLAEEAPVAP